MAEPVSSATGGYWAGKIAYAIGGFLGGASTALFWQPARLREHGKMVAVGAMMVVPCLSAAMLGVMVARHLGQNEADLDVGLAIGWLIGLGTIFVCAITANWFRGHERSNIVEVARDVRVGVRDIQKGTKMAKKPVKKATHKGGKRDVLPRASSSQPMNQR
jgi:hypothetical protein